VFGWSYDLICPVERAAFEDLRVVDAGALCRRVNGEAIVTLVAQIGDRDLEAAAIGTGRAKQNRLVRAAARSPDASQFQNAYRF
jgi:hypothetical protein